MRVLSDAGRGWNLFVYGTLRLGEVMAAVAGGVSAGQPAVLEGYRRCRVRGEAYPGLRRQTGWLTDGILYLGVGGALLRAVDRFEGEEYLRRLVEVRVRAGARLPAFVYLTAPAFLDRLADEAWSLEAFRRDGLADFMAGYAGFPFDRTPAR
ncbi:MAG: gamma-glutamylcyclotransferase family protein [Thermodesulfobacteriota bacterium]